MADVFEEAVTPAEPVSGDFLEQYVGEGKKFKDVNELAKAYANADKFIPELKTDLQNTREFIAEELKKIAERNNVEPPVRTEERREPNPNPVAPPNDAGEDLEARIAKALEERDEVKTFQKNAAIAEQVLIEQLGSKEEAIKAVQAKATEMGVEPSYLREAAFKSPRAFFSLMGIDPESKPTSTSTPAPSADVRPEMIGAGKPKANTYEYYNQLRRSDPKLYWSPKVQAQMHAAAQENPDFFKR